MIVAAGHLVYDALAAADALEATGCLVSVFDPCFLKPMDAEGIWEAAKHAALTVVAEENVASGGLGCAVTRLLTEKRYSGNIRLLCVPDSFVPHGRQQELRRRLGLDAEGMARLIREEIRVLEGG